ncbi:hypothetical protein FQA39_LY16746 [Lamprigera yunnana]|nr:hypothetical protein FQA39_LY16746 [Lamprigera yunnana]
MKLIIVFLCLSSISALPITSKRKELLKKWNDLIAPYKSECIKESGVLEEDVNDVEKILLFPKNNNFKCYLYCLSKQLQVVDANGNYLPDKIVAVIPGMSKEMITKCISLLPKDTVSCNRSYVLTICGSQAILVGMIENLIL